MFNYMACGMRDSRAAWAQFRRFTSARGPLHSHVNPPNLPKRRPTHLQPPVFSIFRRGGVHCGHHTSPRGGPTATKRGNCVIRTSTRRRHAPRRLQVVQNPHCCMHGGICITCDTWSPCRYARQNSPNTGLPGTLAKKFAQQRPTQQPIREKTRPAHTKTPKLDCFQPAGRTISRSHAHQNEQGDECRARDATTWRR